MQKLEKVTFGSDPEFGLINKYTGKAISANGQFPGSKKNPADIGEDCGIQVDGVNLELTIPPGTTKEEFVRMIMYGKQRFQEIATEVDDSIRVISSSSMEYDDEQLSDPEVRIFGCDPSWDIYSGTVCKKPSADEVGNMRCAGFHIHVGVPYLLTVEEIERFIFCMDICCGLPSVIVDRDRDRKKLYGTPGDFRMSREEHLTRVEYRSLGGNCHGTAEHIGYFFDQTLQAIEMYNNMSEMEDLPDDHKYNWHKVQEAIATSNEELVQQLMNIFGVKITVPSIINEKIEELHGEMAEF